MVGGGGNYGYGLPVAVVVSRVQTDRQTYSAKDPSLPPYLSRSRHIFSRSPAIISFPAISFSRYVFPPYLSFSPYLFPPYLFPLSRHIFQPLPPYLFSLSRHSFVPPYHQSLLFAMTPGMTPSGSRGRWQKILSTRWQEDDADLRWMCHRLIDGR